MHNMASIFLPTTNKVLMNLHWQFHDKLIDFEVFTLSGFMVERILSGRFYRLTARFRRPPAPLTLYLIFLKPALRSGLLKSVFDLLRSVFCSVHAPLTCSAVTLQHKNISLPWYRCLDKPELHCCVYIFYGKYKQSVCFCILKNPDFFCFLWMQLVICSVIIGIRPV